MNQIPFRSSPNFTLALLWTRANRTKIAIMIRRTPLTTRKIGWRSNRNPVVRYVTSQIPFRPSPNFSYGLHKTSGHIGRFENGKGDFSTNLGRIPDRVGPLAPGSPWLPFAQWKSSGRWCRSYDRISFFGGLECRQTLPRLRAFFFLSAFSKQKKPAAWKGSGNEARFCQVNDLIGTLGGS